MNFTPEIHAMIVETHAAVVRLEHDLLGNGQPGEIDQVKSRVKSLEIWRYTLTGAAAVVGAAVGWLLKH